ncbi:MAG: alpha-L-fucosidase [Chthoniobacteraceae bacterium]
MTKKETVIAQGPFKAEWESLVNYRVPKWYEDAKFGIFIHWGVYSVPGFASEWYPRMMYQEGTPEFEHHVKTYGPHKKFGYKDFIPMFKAENYDPADWAKLFRQAGAKFVVPVAEHHDGFPMYDCDFTKWCAAKMGPKRDLIGDLATAVRKEKLVFGLSSHRIENWWFYDGGMKFDSDVRDPRNAGLYGPAKPVADGHHHLHRKSLPMPDRKFLNDWLNRTCELVDKYQPQLVYFDWWIQHIACDPYLKKLAAYYYNRAAEWGKGVAIDYKHDAFPEGAAVFDIERAQLDGVQPMFWQSDTAVSKTSWGYVHNHDYKTVTDIIGDLVDVVSKNGALLLNIGPKPDGTIPEPERRMLLDVGEWLKVNGEAIYGTRPWKVFGEGPTGVVEGRFTDMKRPDFTSEDIRFTRKGKVVYAIALGWPTNRRLTIRSLSTLDTISNVELLGSDTKLKWKRNSAGLLVDLPSRKPCNHAFVLKIT